MSYFAAETVRCAQCSYGQKMNRRIVTFFEQVVQSGRVHSFMGVYDEPLYYEIAFSYQQVKKQVDFFVEAAKKYSGTLAKRFLDICCGPSPQLRELARRGYEAIGLDLNPRMLEYLRLRAREENLKIETIEGDMNNFSLKKKCDFAFLLSGSLFVNSNEQFLEHLDCVANALRSDGVYLLENFPLELLKNHKQEWTITQGQIEVKTIFETKVIDELEELYEDTITFEVIDRGEKKVYSTVQHTKNIAPQELQTLLRMNGKFRFVEWFENLEFKPLQTAKGYNMIILRKER
jgi:SAM-dependent methyltransferase